jgi:hypothetical protein
MSLTTVKGTMLRAETERGMGVRVTGMAQRHPWKEPATMFLSPARVLPCQLFRQQEPSLELPLHACVDHRERDTDRSLPF